MADDLEIVASRGGDFNEGSSCPEGGDAGRCVAFVGISMYHWVRPALLEW
jgi:hypothetical protein